jgi:hypothetical protein
MSAIAELKVAQLRKLAATHRIQSALAVCERGDATVEEIAERDAAARELAAATGAENKALKAIARRAPQRH